MYQSSASIFVILIVSVLPVEGAAQSQDGRLCKKARGQESIGACTRLIQSRRLGRRARAEVFFRRGLAHGRAGKARLAIADYTRSIRLNPREAKAWYNRGANYLRLKQYSRALADWALAIRVNPKLIYPHWARGIFFFNRRRYLEAVKDFSSVVRLAPRFAEAYRYRGMAYSALELHHRAVSDFSTALRVNPACKKPDTDERAGLCGAALTGRGQSLEALGRREAAISDYRLALDRFDGSTLACDGLRRLGVGRHRNCPR